MLKRVFILFIPIILGACAYFKDYNPPKTDSAAKTWHNEDKLYNNSNQNLPYTAWWQGFDDATLNQMIESGIINNNNINIAMANVEASAGELKRVKLNWIPSLSTNVGYSSFPDLGFPGALFAVIPTYTMNVFSQIKEQKKAEYELTASKATLDASKLAVIGQITSGYFTYVAEKEELTLFQNLEKDLTELVEINDSMAKGGLSSEINPNQVRSELDSIKAQKLVIEQNVIVSENALNYLLNKNPQQIKLVKKFSDLNGSKVIIGALPLTVIENRPDMLVAKNELEASNEGIGLAFSNLLPTVQLSAARGSISGVPNGTEYGAPIYFNQALLEIPIFNASVYGQIDKAKGLNKASYYRYTDTLRKVLRDVNNDLSAHDLYTKRLSEVSNSKSDIERVYLLNNDLYQQGINSYLELLETKIKLDTALITVNHAKLEQFITIVNLYQSLGGGYDYNKSSK